MTRYVHAHAILLESIFCVFNLIFYLCTQVTDIKLKELFSQKGIVTDVQLKYTKDGKFRRFAFIGYKTEEQAKLAQSFFDQTYIDTCKIFVEQCAALGM